MKNLYGINSCLATLMRVAFPHHACCPFFFRDCASCINNGVNGAKVYLKYVVFGSLKCTQNLLGFLTFDGD